MTRINVVPPETLSLEHLLGEYHEVLRPLNLVRKAQAKGVNKFNFISALRLRLGHWSSFFYNKLYVASWDDYGVTTESLMEGLSSDWYEPTENAIAARLTK